MTRCNVLGPLEVLDASGAPVDLGGRQPRVMVAVLLAAAGRAVPVDAMVDAVWADDPPASALGTLQSYVSRLRRRLDGIELRFEDTGYRLVVDADDVDFLRFERLADEGRRRLEADDAAGAVAVLQEAEGLWRGRALQEFAEQEFAIGLATRLEERRLAATEDRLDAELRLGRHAAAAAELTELVGAHPLRERLRAQLALALYRSGRQADALRALADAGRTLREELGIEPSRPLRELEAAILAHDPALDAPRPARAEAPAAPAAAPARSEPTPPPVAIVGRDLELGQLVLALEESATAGRFVVIEGEPGIGKTSLADALGEIAAAQGALVSWGRSDEGGAAPSLWSWLPPLRAVAAMVGDVDPAVAELLAGAAPLSAGQAGVLQFERFEAVAALLDAAAARRRVVVLLDDVQWADDVSLELLGFLAGRLGRGILVVATVRQLEVGRNDAVTDALAAIARRGGGSRRIVLRGLVPDATSQLLTRVTGRDLPAATVDAIHRRAEGNPFYAAELARLLGDDDDVSADVPGSVGDVIRRRLARLPEATTELLKVAAVVGRDPDLGVVAAVADRPVDAVVDDLEPALVQRILVDVPEQPGALRFSHALVREVLLEDLTSLRRARLHLRVADAIEAAGAGTDDAEILAEHLWQATPVGVGLRAAAALERAAEVALSRVGYAAAEELLSRAVHLRRTSGRTDADHEAELRSLYRLLEVARARRYFQGAASPETSGRAKELAARLGHRDLLLNIMWFEWSALATASRRREAAPVLAAIREVTQDDPDPEARAVGHQIAGVFHWGGGQIADAARELDLARDLVEALPLPDDWFMLEQRLVSRTFWLFNHAAVGDIAAAAVYAEFDELLRQFPDRFVQASVCGFAGTTAVAMRDWDQVAHFAEAAVTVDPNSQFAFWGGQALMHEAIVRAWRGDVDDAVATFVEGDARYVAIGARSGLPTFRAALGLHAARHGRLDVAGRFVTAARAVLEETDERWNEHGVLVAEGVLAHARGDVAAAVASFERAIATATAQGAATWAGRAADLAAELGLAS